MSSKRIKKIRFTDKFFITLWCTYFGYYNKAQKDLTARQKKFPKINIPIYWRDDNAFLNVLSFSSEYPQLFYIANGIVISAFLPIAMDDEFPEKYYSNLISMISRYN